MHVNLIIATPGHSVISGYLHSLLATATELNKHNISWVFTQQYASHVADAREMTINGGSENNPDQLEPLNGQITYDKILWIDSDIIFSPEDVIRAYNSEFDVVAGGYILGHGEVAIYKEIFKEGLSFEEASSLKEPIKIFGAGMGFFCMKAGIFEKLSRPWFQSVSAKLVFNGKEREIPLIGEDLSLCKRINDAGFEIWFDPKIKLTHQKTVKLTWEGVTT